jgi:quinol monooxygenase YgiN
MSITLFATLTVKPGHEAAALNELQQMLKPSQAEPGCLRYEIYQAEKNACSLHLIETYADQQAMEFHSQSSYFQNMVEKVSPLLEKGFDIQLLTRAE